MCGKLGMCVWGEEECSEKGVIFPRISLILTSLSQVIDFEGFLEVMSLGNKYSGKLNIHIITQVSS